MCVYQSRQSTCNSLTNSESLFLICANSNVEICGNSKCNSVTQEDSTVWKPHSQSLASKISRASKEIGTSPLTIISLTSAQSPSCTSFQKSKKIHFRNVSEIRGRNIYYKIVSLDFFCNGKLQKNNFSKEIVQGVTPQYL